MDTQSIDGTGMVSDEPEQLFEQTHSDAQKSSKQRQGAGEKPASRKRTVQPYPSASFEETLFLAEAIHNFAAGEKVRLLTLLKHLDKSPSSDSTRSLITNSAKYGLTKGSYSAEWISLTELGTVASNPIAVPSEKLQARFRLAVEGITPFQFLYSQYKGKRLPTRDVLKDALSESLGSRENLSEYADLFVVNTKFLGLLQTIAGSETLVSIEHVLDEIEKHASTSQSKESEDQPVIQKPAPVFLAPPKASGTKLDWPRICFVITPIGEDGSETRKHADLFLHSLIEPALKELDMEVVRADKIGAAGMITSQILEYVMRSSTLRRK